MSRGRKTDMAGLRKGRKAANARSGGGILKLAEGTTILYICPPVHEESPLPYVEIENMFKFGRGQKVIINGDLLEDDEVFRGYLEDAGIDFDDAREGWEFAGDNHTEGFSTRWYFNVIVMGFRSSPSDDYETGDPVVQTFGCGKSIYDGITDVMFEEGDITDPDAAIFVKIKRTGSGMKTEYKVSTDSVSLKNPVELSDKAWSVVEKGCAAGKSNDLHKFIAGQIRSMSQVEAVYNGEEEDEEVDTRTRKKAKATASKPASARRKKKPAPEPEPEDLEEESEVEEEEEEAPKPKPKRKKKKRAPEPEPEEEDEDDEEEFEEILDDDDDDDDDDDESGDEAEVDDLERALAARAKKKRGK